MAKFNNTRILRQAMVAVVLTGFAAVTILQTGCLDKIELPAPEGVAEALVIQGSVIKGNPSVIQVAITRLFDFTGGSLTPVNVLLAEVTDEDGRTLKLPEATPGLYKQEIYPGSPDYEVEFGKSYQLHVVARDGREYYTNFEPLIELPDSDSISFEVVTVQVENEQGQLEPKDKVRISVFTDTELPNSEDRARLKWEAERTFKVTDTPIDPDVSMKVCYVTESVGGGGVSIVDGNDQQNSMVDAFTVFESSITSFYGEGAYITIYQQSISETAFRYWSNIKSLIERSGNMFEPPAGEVQTNLYNPNDEEDPVYGYFYCYAQDTLRAYVSPESVGNPPTYCPPPTGIVNLAGDCVAAICCDCLDFPASTTQKPEYWIE